MEHTFVISNQDEGIFITGDSHYSFIMALKSMIWGYRKSLDFYRIFYNSINRIKKGIILYESTRFYDGISYHCIIRGLFSISRSPFLNTRKKQ